MIITRTEPLSLTPAPSRKFLPAKGGFSAPGKSVQASRASATGTVTSGKTLRPRTPALPETPRTLQTPQFPGGTFSRPTESSLRRTQSVRDLQGGAQTPTPAKAATIGRGAGRGLSRTGMRTVYGDPNSQSESQVGRDDRSKRPASRMTKEDPKKARLEPLKAGTASEDVNRLTRMLSALSTGESSREHPPPQTRQQAIAFLERQAAACGDDDPMRQHYLNTIEFLRDPNK
ncbi:hypothetical protein NX059_010717 [Plenodomus lindquistii]|nr:hypothetical protein NX059_010717 [Plenodomus lindquistii]